MVRRNTVDDFWTQVDRGGDDDCWPYTGTRQPRGYGKFGYCGKVYLAHRFAYALGNGPLGDEEVVRHTCDNPPCCNPAHLVKGTQLDNIADATERRRMAQGERHFAAKLDAEQAQAIRQRYAQGGITYVQLAAEYGVSDSAIWGIVRGRYWRAA
jgi:hypothetical protein